jgi:quinol monooxygenase YgiN
MSNHVGFCVIYRFKVRDGAENAFRQGWTRITEEIRRDHSGLGSRLHRADDGLWVAYAQWPDRNAWEQSQAMKTDDKEAAKLMAASIEERLPPILMEPAIDLLVK